MAGKSSGRSKKSASSRSSARSAKRSTSTSKRRTSAPKKSGRRALSGQGRSSGKTSASRSATARRGDNENASRSDGPKVGSSTKAARKVGGRGDFGAPESDRDQRNYASRATKSGDPGAQQEHNIGDGTRVSGVGGSSRGAGNSSGGDLDPDVIGVGTRGRGVSQSGGTDRTTGADITEGEADTFASRPPAKKQGDAVVQPGKRGAKRVKQPKGDFVDHSGGDESQTDPGEGAANVTNSRRNDDSFAGEISLDEASGADNAVSDEEA